MRFSCNVLAECSLCFLNNFSDGKTIFLESCFQNFVSNCKQCIIFLISFFSISRYEAIGNRKLMKHIQRLTEIYFEETLMAPKETNVIPVILSVMKMLFVHQVY